MLAFAYYGRAGAYQKKGDYDAAIADFTKVLELNPKAVQIYHLRGAAYQKKGDHDKAIADHTKTVELNPKVAVTYSIRGRAYVEKGDLGPAIDDYTKAIELHPRTPSLSPVAASASKRWGKKIERSPTIGRHCSSMRSTSKA